MNVFVSQLFFTSLGGLLALRGEHACVSREHEARGTHPLGEREASRRGSGADAGDGGSATAGVGVGASAGAIQQFVEIDVKDTGTVSGRLLSFLSSFVLPGVCVRVNLHHLHFL